MQESDSADLGHNPGVVPLRLEAAAWLSPHWGHICGHSRSVPSWTLVDLRLGGLLSTSSALGQSFFRAFRHNFWVAKAGFVLSREAAQQPPPAVSKSRLAVLLTLLLRLMGRQAVLICCVCTITGLDLRAVSPRHSSLAASLPAVLLVLLN